jgi:hypothetical protein
MTIRTLFRLSFVLGGLVAVTGLLAFPCLASTFPTDVILYQDTTDTISVFFNGSPFGTCPEVTGVSCITTANGGTGIPTVGGLVFPINFNIYEDGSLTVLSDTFSLSLQDFTSSGGGPHDIVATFTSDVDGRSLPPLTGGTLFSLVETGDIQTLATVTVTDDFGNLHPFEYQFASDVSDVPEPSSLLLLVVGLLGLVGLRHRAS